MCKKTKIYVSIIPVLFYISFCLTSCGFAYKEHVVGKYYLIGVDTKTDISLSYDLSNGSFVGKAPPRVIAYGYNDTFLVAKSLEYDKQDPSYYIIDMMKDSEYAHEESFRMGPISEQEYNSEWKQKLNIKLRAVGD